MNKETLWRTFSALTAAPIIIVSIGLLLDGRYLVGGIFLICGIIGTAPVPVGAQAILITSFLAIFFFWLFEWFSGDSLPFDDWIAENVWLGAGILVLITFRYFLSYLERRSYET